MPLIPSPTGLSLAPDLLEQRRQAALKVAQDCIHTLTHDCGATEVILFGSLRGDTPWHGRSDVDLAVRGLSSEAIWAAYRQLEPLIPDWLTVDLVSIDEVPPELLRRILQSRAMPDNPYSALQALIMDEQIALERTVQTLEQLLAQAETIPEIALIPALTSYTADFYTGCERIGERVAVALDGGLPTGSNWHEQLLLQMATASDRRPALWSRSLGSSLNEYRRFRHLVRHRYHTQLKPDLVLALASKIRPVLTELEAEIGHFNQWLDDQAMHP
jgi:predicted nucleotidyltransferase